MTSPQPAFYGKTGSPWGDFVTLLHLPYTMWHLSYVVIGASLAPEIDAKLLLGTVVAFGLGLGVGAHALDELHDRPLSTRLSSRTLRLLGWGGLSAGAVLAIAASLIISPVALVWGAAGVLLAAAYSLEWLGWLHTTVGFGLAWGAFPVLVGYWAQTESLSLAVVAVAVAATGFAMSQRVLSAPARNLRRKVHSVSVQVGDRKWDESELLATWENPLRLLALAHVLLAVGLLLNRILL